ncbi:MAG TPA: PAS domain S-box protein [Azospira sp.]|nr:PAS domain S-box protein [Azospira sp.]
MAQPADPLTAARFPLARACRRLFADSFSRRLALAALVSIALTWGLLAVDLWQMQRERVDQAGAQAASLARAVEQRVARTLRITDQVLLLTRGELLRQRAANRAQALRPLLEGSVPHFDEILTVSFIAADGTSLAHSTPGIATGRNYAGSDFYRFHAAESGDPLYIEKPTVDAASGQRVFTLSRALRGERNELLGILVAGVRTDILAEEFVALRIGDNGSLGLHHLPSYLVSARQPDYEQTFAHSLMHRGLQEALERQPQGVFEGAISADNVRRFFAYRKLDGLPLAVTVGVARDDIMRRLHAELAGYLSLLIVLTLAIAGGAVALLRAHHREIALRRDLAEKDSLFRSFFEAVPAGMCTLDREMRYRLVNPAMARINGKPLDAYAGRTVRELHPTLLARLAPIHHDVFANGRELDEVEFSGETAGQPGVVGHWQSTFFPIRDSAGQVSAMGCFVVEVSAQKAAEESLRRNETLLASVLDLLPVGVWVTDPNGRIVRSNPAGEKIWAGKRPVGPERYGEYKGWWADSGRPLGSDEWALARAIHTGETVLGEMVDIESFDGVRKTILNSAMPLHDQHGQLLGAIAVNEDITGIRKAQEEMRIARDFFERTFDAAPVGMAVANIEGRYIKVNRAMTDFIGYTAEELMAMTYLDITHPDDAGPNRDMRDSLIAGEFNSHLVEKRYIRKDGSVVWAMLVVSLVRDADGQPLYTIGQMLDISRQKLAEQALRASAVRFRAIFDNASTGIVASDEHGGVGYFNEAFRLMLGREGEVLRRLNLADFTQAEDLARERRLIEEIRGGLRENYRLEKRYTRPDGSVLWVDSSVSAIRDPEGRILSFVGVVYDVSERKEAELALSSSRHKLRALAAHQTRLLEEDRKHVAREIHDELGQLLTALKMDISLLRMSTPGQPEVQQKLAGMRELVEHTMNVVRHVATNLRPSALDLGLLPAIEWLVDDFSARWEIPCSLDTEGGEIVLNDMMSTAVFRVIQESLTNIARHAGASKVAISLRRDPGMLRVVVRDDGHGFDMAATGQKKGFGLFGMRERVLTVGGKLSIDSTPGQGTTVTITLPVHGGTHP